MAASVAGPPATRSGREVALRVAVGLALVATVLLTLLVRKETFVVLAVVACWGGLWELRAAFARREVHLPILPLLVGAAGILVSAYVAGGEAMLVSFLLTVGGTVVWRVLDGGGASALRDLAGATFATAYLPFLAGFVMLMLAEPDGVARVGLFLLLVVASDVGGYAVGSVFGRHPLAPSVSPKKSWEGLFGSMLLASATGAVGVHLLFDLTFGVGLALGVMAVVTATVGDLAESLLKRDLGLKDMGTLLPGHGGVLDRLDSLLVTAPLVQLALVAMVPIGD